MLEDHGGDILGDGLDEVDVAASDDEPDRIQDHVVGENRAHVVGVSDSARDRGLDIEENALLGAPLVRISADLGCGEEIAQEDDVKRVSRRRL